MDQLSAQSFDNDGAAGDASTRTDERDSLFLAAELSRPGFAHPLKVRVRNLSAGGLMVEMPDPIDAGTRITLDLRNIGKVTGQIAWVAEGRAGVAFDTPIDPKRARKPVGQGGRASVWPPA